jgi:N-acyl amino acid synthase of PEP-CTERM/exosortase system
MSSFDLCQHFTRYFSLLIADNQSLQNEVYKIRYQVYCQELNYESPENFPDEMETDVYDSHSIHCLLQHKATGIYTGCVRIILPENGHCNIHNSVNNLGSQDHNKLVFPWQNFASTMVYPSPEYEWKNICEISRLAVRGNFRKRQGDDDIPLGTALPDFNEGQRRFPLIAMSLYWAAFCLALNLNLDIFAIMEPRLARHLRRCGLRYCLVSDLFDYHGQRGIFYTKPPELLESLDAETYAFFELLNNIIVVNLSKAGYISHPFKLPERTSATTMVFI